MSETKRPEIVTDDHLEFLDDLQESGDCNMFGAGRYLEYEFNINRRESKEIVLYWMESFGKDDR